MDLELSPLVKYQILNEIRPYFKKTKYPYNYWSSEKIIETKKDISLVWSKDKKFLMPPFKKKMGGGKEFNKIFII